VKKKCPKCSGYFECLESTHCWCSFLETYVERPNENEDCVCRTCFLAEPRIEEHCAKHNWIVGVIDPENDMVLVECSLCHKQHELEGIFGNP
jgi:hypothetical protein